MRDLKNLGPVFYRWFKEQPRTMREVVTRAITKTGGVYTGTVQRIHGKQKGPGFINTQINYNGSYED